MKKVSSSPDRHTFQKEGYIERAKEKGEELNQAYIDMWDQIKIDEANRINDPAWQKNNMEYDLRSSKELCDKVKANDTYAQNLYAAMCNMRFQKLDVIPILKDELWSCSWRHAGGIVANMRMQGDYIDWYCSGIGEGLGNGDLDGTKGYIAEGVVTDEIKEDLKQLGWISVEWDKD